MLDKLQEVTNRFTRPVWTLRLSRLVEREDIPSVKLGTSHGGWVLPESAVLAGGIAVCAGAGEDISFDVELNKKGFEVYTVDPTPRSKQHAARVVRSARENTTVPINRSSKEFYNLIGFDESRYHYEDVGLWNEDTTMHFFAPKNPDHVSHSIVNLQRTEADTGFEAKCLTLDSFCKSRGIDHIDLFKLDVEGAEYSVIESLLASRFRPSILCIDFDEIRTPIDGNRKARLFGALESLGKAGYKFRDLDKTNALLVRTLPNYSVAEAAD